MKAITGREFSRMVERRGWQLLRISGSHHIYSKPGSVARLSIPIHGNRPLKIGLLRPSPSLPKFQRTNCDEWPQLRIALSPRGRALD